MSSGEKKKYRQLLQSQKEFYILCLMQGYKSKVFDLIGLPINQEKLQIYTYIHVQVAAKLKC